MTVFSFSLNWKEAAKEKKLCALEREGQLILSLNYFRGSIISELRECIWKTWSDWSERYHCQQISKENAYNFSCIWTEVSSSFTKCIITLNSTNQQCPLVSLSRQFNSTLRKREVFRFPSVCVLASVQKPLNCHLCGHTPAPDPLWGVLYWLTGRGVCVQADLLDWMIFSPDPPLLAYKCDDSGEHSEAWAKCAHNSRSLHVSFWAEMWVGASS